MFQRLLTDQLLWFGSLVSYFLLLSPFVMWLLIFCIDVVVECPFRQGVSCSYQSSYSTQGKHFFLSSSLSRYQGSEQGGFCSYQSSYFPRGKHFFLSSSPSRYQGSEQGGSCSYQSSYSTWGKHYFLSSSLARYQGSEQGGFCSYQSSYSTWGKHYFHSSSSVDIRVQNRESPVLIRALIPLELSTTSFPPP